MRDIMWRMVEPEMKHPYRAGCKHCEAKKSAKTTQA